MRDICSDNDMSRARISGKGDTNRICCMTWFGSSHDDDVEGIKHCCSLRGCFWDGRRYFTTNFLQHFLKDCSIQSSCSYTNLVEAESVADDLICDVNAFSCRLSTSYYDSYFPSIPFDMNQCLAQLSKPCLHVMVSIEQRTAECDNDWCNHVLA